MKAKTMKEALSATEAFEEANPTYRYMYLKTYAKFTFCIKSQGHVADENFLYYCMHPASKISSHCV